MDGEGKQISSSGIEVSLARDVMNKRRTINGEGGGEGVG